MWSAAVISDIGTWVQLIVVGSLVASNTGSAVRTGLVALATFMPQGFASPIGGLLADRFDRRKVFSAALLLQALMTSILAAVLGAGIRTSSVLTVLILLGSAAGSLGAPSYSAMQPDLVPHDELMAMLSLGVYSWNSGRIIGPIIGTLLAAAVGPAWTITFNAATFLVMSLTVWSLRKPFLPHESSGSITERLSDGWQAMRSTPGCWNAIVLLVFFNIFFVPFMGLIPIYATSVFHGGTGLAGLISSAQGIGAIIGGITITAVAARTTRSVLLPRLMVFMATALVLYALAPNTALVMIAVAVVGGGSSAMFITGSAVVQRDAPPERRGRVMSIMQALMGTCYGLGLLLIGTIGDLVNLRVAFIFGAVAMLCSFVWLTRRSRNWRAAFDGPAHETSFAVSV